jgi:hypothetical protein
MNLATFVHLRSNPGRMRVAYLQAWYVLATMPTPKHTATETMMVATGKELRVRDTEYFTEVSSPSVSRTNRN